MYDLIILGGGPAGTAACVYAARKQLKTAITGSPTLTSIQKGTMKIFQTKLCRLLQAGTTWQ